MNSNVFSNGSMSRILKTLIFVACASLATFQVAEANSVGGWEQSRGEWEHEDGHGGCGGGGGDSNGLPCGLTDQTATFLAFNSDQNNLLKAGGTKQDDTQNISIKYDLTGMLVDSATLWIKAMDDATGPNADALGTKRHPGDGTEQMAITTVEGTHITPLWTEVNGLDWYIGLDVMQFISDPHTSPLTALLAIKNVSGMDFYFENAKLDLNYHTEPCPPSPVPLPAAAWLFGSALFGFITLSNRRKV